MTLAPRFPCDLAGTPGRLEMLLVAGRVLDRSGSQLILADAVATLTLTIEGVIDARVAALEAGDLASFRGHWDGLTFNVAALQFRQAAPLPRGDGDIARFSFQGVGQKLALRSRVLRRVRDYFEREGFVEVETPSAVPAPGVDRNVEAVRAEPGWFITSPELEMKRLLVGGVPRQFQLARVRRRDESGRLHESEFTLLEWYRAFAGQEEMLRDTESVVCAAAEAVNGRAELTAPDGRVIDVRPPFERESVAAVFQRHAGIADVSDLAQSEPERYFRLLVEAVEPALARSARPVFLMEYPISEAALAQPCKTDPRFAERFELYVGGVELCNGYGELTDPLEQRRRFELEAEQRARLGQTVYPVNERFLSALVAGMPPAGGNALGFDRLVMLASGARTLQDVIAFPAHAL